jgi:beta-glucosidase-like glycosyl hydrolase
LDAYQLGRITAIEARAIGIHWTFSPVADLNSNPENPIINTRSWGESPRDVGPLLSAYIRGASDHGLLTTAKHFPGHGDTGTDSHINLPVLDACWPRLDTLELAPFQAAIDAGVSSVMTAHIAVKCLDGDDTVPATLSPAIMTGVLRDSMGFDGIVVTDALGWSASIRPCGGCSN